MNTNSIPYLDTIVKWSTSLDGLPSSALVFIFCMVIGYTWKAVGFLPNRLIPTVVMLTGGVALTLLTWATGTAAPLRLKTFVIGFIIGFFAWMFHAIVIKRIVKRYGLTEPGETGDTEITTKPEGNKQP